MLPADKTNMDAVYKDGFSFESGNDGHPDKLCAQISDTNSRRTSDTGPRSSFRGLEEPDAVSQTTLETQIGDARTCFLTPRRSLALR